MEHHRARATRDRPLVEPKWTCFQRADADHPTLGPPDPFVRNARPRHLQCPIEAAVGDLERRWHQGDVGQIHPDRNPPLQLDAIARLRVEPEMEDPTPAGNEEIEEEPRERDPGQIPRAGRRPLLGTLGPHRPDYRPSSAPCRDSRYLRTAGNSGPASATDGGTSRASTTSRWSIRRFGGASSSTSNTHTWSGRPKC